LPYPCSLQPTYAVAPAAWQKVRHPEDPGQPTNHTAETLGHMLKKTTDTLTMTSNYIHNRTRTDLMTEPTRLDRQCNRTRKQMTNKEEKIKSPRFAFLKISASAHLAHLQSRTNQPVTQALQKSQILLMLQKQRSIFLLKLT